MPPTSVTFDRVTYHYRGNPLPAVKEISFTAAPGEVVVLVGPSGCGKSTLLRLVAGLIQPTQGEILMDGGAVTALAPEARQVGWVPQSYALFDHLSVAENVAFGLRMRRVERAHRQQQVHALLELCQIAPLATRRVHDLSGGQRQRVAIARALAIQPQVLLLDEPLAALDPQLREELRDKLGALIRSSGVTTLFVTHDQGEALSLAQRIVVLRDGVVEQTGTPTELWHAPANAFVAEFLSGAVVVAARPCAADRVEVATGLILQLNAPPLHPVTHVALRPHDLVLSSEGLPVIVERAEYKGGYYQALGRSQDGLLFPFRATESLHLGDRVRVRGHPDARVSPIGGL